MSLFFFPTQRKDKDPAGSLTSNYLSEKKSNAVMPFALEAWNENASSTTVQVRGHYPAVHGATYALVN